MSFFEVTVRGDKELITKLGAMPDSVRKELRREVNLLGIKMLQLIQSKLRGPVLHYITGQLFRSIQLRVTESSSAIFARLFSAGDVVYAGIHEYGGTINIPEIRPVNALALRFAPGGGEAIFRMYARAHTVTMPERSFMRSSLDDMRSEIIEGMREAVMTGVRK